MAPIKEDVFHVGIKGLIRSKNGEILLLKANTKALSLDGISHWDMPGGRMQRHEMPEATLRREIMEEIGIEEVSEIQPFTTTLSSMRIPQSNSDSVGLILWVFFCSIPLAHPITLSAEHTAFAWFKLGEAAKKLSVKYPMEFIDALKILPQ